MSMFTTEFTTIPTNTGQPKGKYVMAAQCIASGQYAPPTHSHHFVGVVVGNDGNILEYRHLIKMETHKILWARSFASKLGRLFHGIRDISGTNTCTFICKSQVPSGIHPTYGKIVCSIQNHKDKRERTRLTVRGNWIEYTGNKATPTADLITSKLLFNPTISTPGAK